MAETRSSFEILDELTKLAGAMHKEAPPPSPCDRSLSKLEAVVTRLSQAKKTRPAKCPPDYVDLWRRVGSSGADELTGRAVRYLSWETDIAILPAFQALALMPDRISARSIQGLVRSVHRRWNSIVNTPAVGNLVIAIAQYDGKNPLIEKWKSGLPHVLNQNGPRNFAGSILKHGKSWDEYADQWGLEADTEFGNQVLEKCVAQSLSRSGSDSEALLDAVIRLVLPNKHWKPASFKTAIQQLILACPRSSQKQTENLTSFIQSDFRLLDPRLPGNSPNWAGIGESARDLVIQWLSAEDIQLFFDHVLPKRDDPHGRKPFWMKYKSKVKRSRPLLASHDEHRWLANAATQGKRNFGQMEFYCDTSAFLLDFGRIMVVEFSKVGNAVYIYERREMPGLSEDFWSNVRFSLRDLKDKTSCIGDPISHIADWQRKVRTLLAQYGIYPGA
jgi:hypothetical protein